MSTQPPGYQASKIRLVEFPQPVADGRGGFVTVLEVELEQPLADLPDLTPPAVLAELAPDRADLAELLAGVGVATERTAPRSVRLSVSAQADRLDWYEITFLAMLLRVLGRRSGGIRRVNGVADHPVLHVIA